MIRYNHRLKAKVQERRTKEVQVKQAARIEAEMNDEAAGFCVLDQATPPENLRAELIVIINLAKLFMFLTSLHTTGWWVLNKRREELPRDIRFYGT